jgi:3-oxoacyl-[acyl-carrier protein] reductase
MTNLDTKIALVTGASRGIGRATAVALANGGARVIIHYGRSASEAQSLRKQIDAAGGDADIVSADLAAPDGPANLAKQVRGIAGEKLDILVANAGIGKAAPIEEHTIEDFDNLFATNVRAPFFLVQQLLPLLTENSSVVLVSSLAARVAPGSSPGAISLPAYASTKGALDTLVKPPQKSPKSKREQVPPRHWVETYLTYCRTTRGIASSRKKGVCVNYPHSLNVRSGIPGSNVLE